MLRRLAAPDGLRGPGNGSGLRLGRLANAGRRTKCPARAEGLSVRNPPEAVFRSESPAAAPTVRSRVWRKTGSVPPAVNGACRCTRPSDAAARISGGAMPRVSAAVARMILLSSAMTGGSAMYSDHRTGRSVTMIMGTNSWLMRHGFWRFVLVRTGGFQRTSSARRRECSRS